MTNKILQELKQLKTSSKSGYKIYFEDELLAMNSGKYIWKKRAEAMNALIASLKYTMGWNEYYKEKTHEVLEELIEKGVIKIEYYEHNPGESN